MPHDDCIALERLTDFVNCLLPEQDATEVESHLERCADCEAIVTRLEESGPTLLVGRGPGKLQFEDEPEFQHLLACVKISLTSLDPVGAADDPGDQSLRHRRCQVGGLFKRILRRRAPCPFSPTRVRRRVLSAQ